MPTSPASVAAEQPPTPSTHDAAAFCGEGSLFAPPAVETPAVGETGVWVESVTEEGYTYWHNTQTGESTWEPPSGAAPALSGAESPTAPPETEASAGGACKVPAALASPGAADTSRESNDVTTEAGGAAGYCAAANEPWIEGVDDAGFAYWYNSLTGESVWERPAQPLSEVASAHEPEPLVVAPDKPAEGGVLPAEREPVEAVSELQSACPEATTEPDAAARPTSPSEPSGTGADAFDDSLRAPAVAPPSPATEALAPSPPALLSRPVPLAEAPQPATEVPLGTAAAAAGVIQRAWRRRAAELEDDRLLTIEFMVDTRRSGRQLLGAWLSWKHQSVLARRDSKSNGHAPPPMTWMQRLAQTMSVGA